MSSKSKPHQSPWLNLKNTFLPFQPSSSLSSTSNITQAPDQSWDRVGTGRKMLFSELETLYWDGVESELRNVLFTLRVWRRSEYGEVSMKEEEGEDLIHGFDTFVGQVSEVSRAYAIRYGESRLAAEKRRRETTKNALGYFNEYKKKEYVKSLAEVIEDRKTEYAVSKIRSEIRQGIEGIPRLGGMKQRAWMLLQASGFLDIDKLIEYRPPLDNLSFWRRPAIPQLTLSSFDRLWSPKLEPMLCSNPDCKRIICGSLFIAISPNGSGNICEDCYRRHHYGKRGYIKSYKRCILQDEMMSAISRKMCRCKDVPHYDECGKPLGLIPVDKKLRHVTGQDAANGAEQCGILKLREDIAQAKYEGLRSIVGKKKVSQNKKKKKMQKSGSEKRKPNDSGAHINVKMSGWNTPTIQTTTKSSLLHSSRDRIATSSTTSVATEPEADDDIPLFFRKFTEKYPFGNVHMALRIGPLVIENGVAHTKGGALVTIREPPVFQSSVVPPKLKSCSRAFAIAGDSERTLWKQTRPNGNPKRYKAMMKQVVGVPFTAISGSELELEIIDDLLSASSRPFDDSGLPLNDQEALLAKSLKSPLEKLKRLIGARVRRYLDSIVDRILDPTTHLTWNATKNNCQNFCDALIDKTVFGPLVNGVLDSAAQDTFPLYLMNFSCPDKGYLGREVASKFDVPSGLTEEYLLRFHFGRHDEADVLDTYQEYWYDWGAFGGPIYKYQDIFPWDCTEAYGRYPTRCGDCNIAKHVWAFPFDSWSMISLHLTRDCHLYAPSVCDKAASAVGEGATSQSWMRNRLWILLASDALTRGAVAMARSSQFCKATTWLHEYQSDDSLLKTQPSLARVKLGGIHRAQPFSHYFEAGTYSHYFLAEWALWSRQEQIQAYELLRDGRVRLPDVPIDIATRGRFSFDDDHYLSGYKGFEGYGPSNPSTSTAQDSAWDTHICPSGSGLGAVDSTQYEGGCAVRCGANCAVGCGTAVPDTSAGDGGGDDSMSISGGSYSGGSYGGGSGGGSAGGGS